MLRTQSRDGRIDLAGVRAVRQAILTGEAVHRCDVLAVITLTLELNSRLEESRRAHRENAKLIALPGRPDLVESDKVRTSTTGSWMEADRG